MSEKNLVLRSMIAQILQKKHLSLDNKFNILESDF